MALQRCVPRMWPRGVVEISGTEYFKKGEGKYILQSPQLQIEGVNCTGALNSVTSCFCFYPLFLVLLLGARGTGAVGSCPVRADGAEETG